jgi:hypothetical protein
LTVTVDPHLIQAAQDAVDRGQANSLSAWVNHALADRAEKDRRLRALGAAIASFEDEFGVLTADELATQARTDRAGARVVRGEGRRVRRSTRKRGAA